jgi:iron complex outermembrane receptor protein
MLKRLFLQGLLVIFTFWGHSQTVFKFNGVVKNSSNESIIGAQFLHPYSLRILSISNESGSFDFSADTNVLIVQQMGYKNRFVRPKDQWITLSEESDLLNTIVVSENKRASQLKKATISMSIISPDLIQNTAPTNVSESIERINAVQVIDNQPTIRGGSGWSYGAGSRVGVLVDGVPLLSGDASSPLWSFMPTEGVSGVEIIKGASSVIYGSSALNGIIHIKTRKPTTDPYTQLTLSRGGYDLPKRKSLHFQGNQRNTISNLTVYHTEVYEGIGVTLGVNLLDDESYKMSDFDRRGRVNLGLRKAVAKHNLVYGINASYQEGKSGSFLLWESLDLGYTVSDSLPTISLTERISIDPYIKWQKGSFSHSLNTRFLGINNDVDNGDNAMDQSNKSNLLFAEYQVNFSPSNSKLNVIGGLLVSKTNSKSPLYSGDHTSENYASYIQLDHQWNKLKLSGGARYEHFILDQKDEGRPVFRAGLNYEAAKYTFIRSSFGQGYRFPSIAESFILTSAGPVSVFPSNNLVSETGTNLELGIQQGFRIKKLNLMFDVAIFQMKFENMMEFTFGQWGPIEPPTFGIGFKTLNTGKTSVQGMESNLLFDGEFKGLKLQGFVGYTYSKSRALEPTKVIEQNATYRNTSSDTTDDILKYRPQHVIKADLMAIYKKWHLGFGATYQSSVQNIDGAFLVLVPGVQESQDLNLSEYVLLNGRIGYRVSSHWDTNIIINNISNREYIIRPADIAAPRCVRFQITYTLDKSK